MIKVIECNYVWSDEYRTFVNLMAKSGFALSKDTWWVEIDEDGYHLHDSSHDYGSVSKADIANGGIDLALWKLVGYLKRNSPIDGEVIVFPRNWGNSKSNEFLMVSKRREWLSYLG